MSNICAIYTRLSKEDELEVSSSIQNQIKNLTEYAKNNNFKIYKIYTDDGVSGRDFNRPSFKELLKDLKNKKFNILLVKDISRIGRNLIKVGEFVDETLPIYNIRLISILDNYDSKYYENEESIVLRSFINEYYLKDCRKKSLNAIAKIKDKKPILKIGRYGYDLVDGKLIINNEEAIIIKRIFNEYLSGKRTSEIIKDLKKDKIYGVGYLRSLKSSHKVRNDDPYFWDAKSINRILKDETYIGNFINNINSNFFETATIYNSHEAIISKEDFDKAQQLISNNRVKHTPSKYAGLFRHKLDNKPLLYRNRDKTYLYSTGFSISIPLLEKILNKEIDKTFIELTKNPDCLLKQLNSDILSYKEKSYIITNKINSLNCKIKSTFEEYINQNISSYEYKNIINKINLELEFLNNELSKLKILIDTSYNQEQYKLVVKDFLKKKEIINDPIILAKILFKEILISKVNDKYIFEFKYNI